MKRIRLDRWANQLQPPRNPRLHLQQQRCSLSHKTRAAAPRREWQCQRRYAASRRKASSAAVAQVEDVQNDAPIRGEEEREQPRPRLNAPSHKRALHSAKLSALHARLSLPPKLPLQTLARCLIDPSVDTRPGYNNAPFALLGQDLLGYYTAEWLLCHYPRLPMPVLFAAQYAYAGSETLAAMRAEWGVEVVAAPGPEVDPGLLQVKRVAPGNAHVDLEGMRVKDMPQTRRLGTGRQNEQWHYRRGLSSRIVFDDQFGDLQHGLPPADAQPYPGAPVSTRTEDGEGNEEETDDHFLDPSISAPKSLFTPPSALPPAPQPPINAEPTTVEVASASFIRALAGALYLHAGTNAAKAFHADHVLSRHLPLHTLFHFTHPTRDLSFLCKREDFEPPVARLISETGRLSRTPVFVVGIFSGDEKLGEGAGSSLNEARIRAAAAALRSWYLYSPPESEVVLPSEVEGVGKGGVKKKWKPQVVDIGEIVA